VNLLVPDGEAAFQDVPHFHVHVIPRYSGDGFGLTFPPDYEQIPARAELDVISQHIRSAVEGGVPRDSAGSLAD
ncbi:MAG TPA: HIT domain-containing protein, partial [Candidatus Dormibacteraeota bacterium]|nr:HIT domain-containing protein [Candidatus Dormibacteraeota bacterium]